MHEGKEDPKALSDADKEKIQTQIQKDVLETHRHGRITFRSSLIGFSIRHAPPNGSAWSSAMKLQVTASLSPRALERFLHEGRRYATTMDVILEIDR